MSRLLVVLSVTAMLAGLRALTAAGGPTIGRRLVLVLVFVLGLELGDEPGEARGSQQGGGLAVLQVDDLGHLAPSLHLHHALPHTNITEPPSAPAQNDAMPSTPSTMGSRSPGARWNRSIDIEHARIRTLPIALTCRSVSLQCTGFCSCHLPSTDAPSGPASAETPWSLRMESRRNASRAQYCSRTCTERPEAAAPAISIVAESSLSSVPENSTSDSGSRSLISHLLSRRVAAAGVRP